jgi:ABC-2 type transport system ATP-binding protein
MTNTKSTKSVFDESKEFPLSIQNATLKYDEKIVLDALDWTPSPGKITGLLGKNGAGKTSLLECALGLRPFQSGQAQIFGASNDALPDVIREQIGFVPQKSELFEWLTVGQMLQYIGSFYSYWDVQKVDLLLQRWEINPNAYIRQLSIGQKQRLSIIRALGHHPRFLVLDEPAAGLDPGARREFLREIVDSMIENETTIIFSTHILTDLERIAVDVAFLHQGKIKIAAPLDTLSEEVVCVSGRTEALALLQPLDELSRNQDKYGDTRIIAKLNNLEFSQAEKLKSTGVRIERLQLEELFIEVTR